VTTEPDPEGDRSGQIFNPGQKVPVVIDGVEVGRIDATDILA
jgi:hypothetical protein